MDILVNNLGIFGSADPLEISDEEWRRYFEVNVLAAVRLTRTYLPGMTERGWGRIQYIASDSAVVIPAEMIHYGMSKTALLAVGRGFAKQAAGTGVTVNSVIAGPTHTGGVEDFVYELVDRDLPWDEAQREFMREHRPQSLLQRLIEPEEIANMVVYLSSDQASATTGGALRVDGGLRRLDPALTRRGDRLQLPANDVQFAGLRAWPSPLLLHRLPRPSQGLASATSAQPAAVTAISMITAIGSELSSPNTPTNGAASAPNRNCSPPRRAEAAPGALRPRAWPMLRVDGKTMPMPPAVTNRVIQVPARVSPRSAPAAPAPAHRPRRRRPPPREACSAVPARRVGRRPRPRSASRRRCSRR